MSIVIPESVTIIDYDAFYNCTSLRSITIPSSVTSIGENAFFGCDSLTTVNYNGTEEQWNLIELAVGNEQLIKSAINFQLKQNEETTEMLEFLEYKIEDDKAIITGNKNNPTNLIIPSEIEGKPVTNIGDGAFYDCSSLESIVIPESVTIINYDAFYNCNSLRSITIPSSVTSIGENAFFGCDSLTTVNYNGTEEQWNLIELAVGNEQLINLAINFQPKTDFITGDINGDGKITATDARLILRISAKLEKLEDYPNAMLIADVNGDNKITAVDARKVLRVATRLDIFYL